MRQHGSKAMQDNVELSPAAKKARYNGRQGKKPPATNAKKGEKITVIKSTGIGNCPRGSAGQKEGRVMECAVGIE